MYIFFRSILLKDVYIIPVHPFERCIYIFYRSILLKDIYMYCIKHEMSITKTRDFVKLCALSRFKYIDVYQHLVSYGLRRKNPPMQKILNLLPICKLTNLDIGIFASLYSYFSSKPFISSSILEEKVFLLFFCDIPNA